MARMTGGEALVASLQREGVRVGDLVGLQDKRVGIVGTGATGVQAAPQLGRWAKELFVFQRTPSAVDVRNDRPTDPEWSAGLHKGWQRERIEIGRAHV